MYLPVIISADRRHRSGMAPLRLQNMYAQPVPTDAGKPVRAALVPTSGRITRLDIGATIQGMFAEPGVRGGALFVAAGGKLYRVSSAWAAIEIGSIGSTTAPALFTGLRDKLYVACNGLLYGYDGSSFAQVTDVDLPSVSGLTVLSQRLVVIEPDADTLSWSATLDGASWEALGFSTAEQRPDTALALARVSGQLVVLGQSSIEVLRPTGSESLPFANVASQSIDGTAGILSSRAWAVRGDRLYFIGGTLAAYAMSGFSAQPLPTNAELEAELRVMTQAQRDNVSCAAFTEGTHEFFVVRLADGPSYVLDISTGLWHTRRTFDANTWAPKHYARAYGYDVFAEDAGSTISTLDVSSFSEGGSTVERIATLKLSVPDYVGIGSLCLDLQAWGRPATGQGSSPKVMIDVTTDGRKDRDDTRAEIMLPVGADGVHAKPTLWGLGMASPGEGMTITITYTDPIGLTIYGAWINEGQQ